MEGKSRTIGKLELARSVGCSPSQVSMLVRKLPADALDGNRLRLDHPDVAAWVQRRAIRAKTPREASSLLEHTVPSVPSVPHLASEGYISMRNRGRPPGSSEPAYRTPTIDSPPAEPRDSEAQPMPAGAPELDSDGFSPEVNDLKLRDICERWGTLPQFRDWIEASLKLERCEELYTKNRVNRGELIERELVMKRLISAIDSAFHQLLLDAPRTISARLAILCRTGASDEEQERLAREIISKSLKLVTSNMEKMVRGI